MGTIEFHGWGSRVDKVEKPDRLVFDLDPDVGPRFRAGEAKRRCSLRDAARRPRASKTFPMLTGGKGIHVVVPLDASARLAEGQELRRALLAARSPRPSPRRFTANIRKVQRKGRIFLDWLRNQRGATAVMPYSARAREGAPVAAPIAWEELDEYQAAAMPSRSATPTSCSSAPGRSCLQAGARRSKRCRMHSRTRARHCFHSCFFLLTAASPAELQHGAKQAARVTITRDDWGIAHVHGKTDADAVFGMIYAQAEDDFNRDRDQLPDRAGPHSPRPRARRRSGRTCA